MTTCKNIILQCCKVSRKGKYKFSDRQEIEYDDGAHSDSEGNWRCFNVRVTSRQVRIGG